MVNEVKRTRDVLEHWIFPQLSKVKKIGDWKWMSCCPAHDDKSPSFSIKVAEDGRILLHCFGGCRINEICDSLGIEVSSLFPPDDHYKPIRRPVTEPSEDTLFIAFCKDSIRKGRRLDAATESRYRAAVQKEARA